METQTWWLSFCDSDRPQGQQFLGVAVLDVTADEMADAIAEVTYLRAIHGLPPADDPPTHWMAAAVRKAHLLGCNPGGEVAAWRMDDVPACADELARLPRHQLLSKADLDALGVI